MNDLIPHAQSVLFDAFGSEGVGLLTTADDNGVPHSTWMATIEATDDGTLVALTSPDSRKVSNILENPNVEWLFSSKDFLSFVYFSGVAEVLNDPSEMKGYWNSMIEKDRAYFLDKGNSSPGFSIIKTHVDSIQLVQPKENLCHDLDVSKFWETSSGSGLIFDCD